jgi:hypothetical protein
MHFFLSCEENLGSYELGISPDSILQQIDWNVVWILFLVYLISGVVLKIIYLSLR